MTQCEEFNDDHISNTLELFSELDEVLKMIDNLKVCHAENFEKEYEKFSEILTRYQEQPHLLDKHLDVLLGNLLTLIRESNGNENLMHAAFKYLYTICKVRTFKALVKFLPHELSDLEFALVLLEHQNPMDSNNWESRYILLLWMSILVLNPFHMSRLDAYITEESENLSNSCQQKTKMERIFNICKTYAELNDTCSSVTAYLTSKYLIRADMKEIYLEPYFRWVIEHHSTEGVNAKFGQLAAVAAILKLGKRDDLLPYADMLLKWILSCNYKDSSDFLKYKYYIKIIQRIGLVYLKPVVAVWRYKRGLRSLAVNLQGSQDHIPEENGETIHEPTEDVQAITIPDSTEDVIEELLQGLRSASSDVRWSAAKGIGRVTSRLPKMMADEVIGSIIEILNPIEPHEAWHGSCLALAELAKRGLLLLYRLKDLVPLLLQALFYDEMKGYMSVGQHIRDSACYMCWAFARAYQPQDLQPFVTQISAGLLTTACFDREINCRRAASAAFQESVGRLGNFPYGIEISTAADFYTVGLRQNSFLQISSFIAQFEEYQKPLIDHLVQKKVGHWDISIRELTAKALNKLTFNAPNYVSNEILPILFTKTDSIDINSRHGAVLAIGEIANALKMIEIKSVSNQTLLTNQIVCELNELIPKFIGREQYRGLSGEMMKQCSIAFIHNCSQAKISAGSECVASWQEIIDKCIINKNVTIRETSTSALTSLCSAFYVNQERLEKNVILIETYIKGTENDLEEHIRMGYLTALGALPKPILLQKLNEILNTLILNSLPSNEALKVLSDLSVHNKTRLSNENQITLKWSEARRDSVKALSNVVETVGFHSNELDSNNIRQYYDNISVCYLNALDEYTLDNRGDIGAWVREAAMNALYHLLTICPHELLKPDFVHKVMNGLSQQAVEKIDRTRGLAGRLFNNLVNTDPPLPYIAQHEKVKEIFGEDSNKTLWLFADHTFPLFCSLLEFPEYSKRIVLGLSASIGQLTESLIKYSSAAFFKFLRSHPNDVNRICNEILNVFEENSLNERVTYPMLNFLDILLSSGTVNAVLMDENSNFADEIWRLVNIEIKGHKKLYKLISSINVYCQLIQVPHLSVKILSKLSIFLGLTHVHVRKTTATKLYEAIALHGDSCGIEEENLDEIFNLLSESDWGRPLVEIRPIRNELCKLMGVSPPIPNPAKIPS